MLEQNKLLNLQRRHVFLFTCDICCGELDIKKTWNIYLTSTLLSNKARIVKTVNVFEYSIKTITKWMQMNYANNGFEMFPVSCA